MLCNSRKSCSCSSVMIAVLWMSIPLSPQYRASLPLSPQYRASLSSNDGGTMRHLRFVQRKNALLSMEVSLAVAGKVTWVSPEQYLNAASPMVVRPSGKMTEASPVQPLNAFVQVL